MFVIGSSIWRPGLSILREKENQRCILDDRLRPIQPVGISHSAILWVEKEPSLKMNTCDVCRMEQIGACPTEKKWSNK